MMCELLLLICLAMASPTLWAKCSKFNVCDYTQVNGRSKMFDGNNMTTKIFSSGKKMENCADGQERAMEYQQ